MISIERVDWEHPDGVRLRQAQRTELDARYGSDDHEPGTAPSAADIEVFLLAKVEDRYVGCGGLRVLNASEAEIKRMYVEPEHRGTGAATAVLRSLEDEGRELGLVRLVLETGTEQPDAIRFYEREGYTQIPLFGSYVGSDISACYAREL